MHLDKIDVMELYDISKHNQLGREMNQACLINSCSK
jgi:hypothetical protein